MTLTPPRVCILDYGAGNVGSVRNLFAAMDTDVIVSNAPADVEGASHLVLPGVGAFGAAIDKIKQRISVDMLRDQVHHHKKPFLGLCVGMQVLATRGDEFGQHAGLGFIDGVVARLDAAGEPLPHMGWNNVQKTHDDALTRSLPPDVDFYFVHSFVFTPTHDRDVRARTHYGSTFASMVGRDNVWGAQFHPEKSQRAGRMLFESFLQIRAGVVT